MARWRLTQPHYIGKAQWRHEETSQASGERIEKMYDVPRYLDPGEVRQQNADGDVVVFQGKRTSQREWEFDGPPTPDMEPLDEEAEAISAKYRGSWVPPIESLPTQLDASLFTQLQRENEALKAQLDGKPARR